MKDTMIRLANISKYYMAGQNVAMGLNGITLSFSLGEFVAITGESGSGKSTLAHVIAGILPYEDGELYIEEMPTSHYDGLDWERYRRDRVSYISQEYGILPGNTVLENVISALRLSGMDEKEARQKADDILKQVELWDMRKRRAAKLSSGQKQRLSIARALAKPAPILIADEPTGNLDAENSNKVIRLLAQAAKERLVILVTHEFEEAADYVSRRIVLQDGQVTQDSRIKNDEKMIEPIQSASSGKDKGLAWYAARLQLVSRPVWTIFMMMFFALTAFGVFAVLGTFYASLDDVSTRYYSNSAFRNGNDRRIVVQHPDGQPMKEDDYEKLIGLSHVTAVERYDLLQDINYYYREDIDLEFKYRQQGGSGQEVRYTATPVFKNYNLFMQTVPVLPEGQIFLSAGKLPEHANEVVAVGDESLIGSRIRVYIQNRKSWSEDAYILKDVTVTGVTEYGEGLYFDERMGRMINQAFYGKESIGMIWGVGDELDDHEITFSQRMVELYGGHKGFWNDRIITNPNNLEEQLTFTAIGENPSRYFEYLEMSEIMFDKMVMGGDGYQVSVFIEDYSYTDRVIHEIMDLGYEAVSPYRLGSVQQIDRLAQARMNTLLVCLLAMAAVMVLQVVIVRAMFGLEMSSYRILRDIGLTCHSACLSVLWQVLFLTIVGQGIGLIVLVTGQWINIEYIINVTKFLGAPQVLLLCLLHLAASLLTVIWAAGALRHRIYPLARREDDLEWEEGAV